MAEFFSFVKRKKEETPEKSKTAGSRNQQILLPEKGGLWVPDGSTFPDSALKSLDFRRAMSSFMPS